jgi:hypothetical protein
MARSENGVPPENGVQPPENGVRLKTVSAARPKTVSAARGADMSGVKRPKAGHYRTSRLTFTAA